MPHLNNSNLDKTYSPFLKNMIKAQNNVNVSPRLNEDIIDEVKLTTNTTNVNDEIQELSAEFEKTKNQQGLTGKLWDGFKNLLHFKSGSNYVEQSIKDCNDGKITKEQAKEILVKYQDGQNICVDMVADITSSIVAVGVFSTAASGVALPIALGLSFLSGAGIKAGGKCFGAKRNDREYTAKNLVYDIATGGVNGLLAPITNGLGSNLTKTIGAKLGLEILGDTAKTGAKTTLKSILLNQSIDVAGGNIGKRAIALGAGMALDGALGGTADNITRATLEGKDANGVAKAGLEGLIGGLIMSPVIGGGFRVAGKLGKKIGQIIFKNQTPDTSIKTPRPNSTVSDGSNISTNTIDNPATLSPKANTADVTSDGSSAGAKIQTPSVAGVIDVKKARFDELSKLSSSWDSAYQFSNEFIEKASKEFSDERYALLVALSKNA